MRIEAHKTKNDEELEVVFKIRRAVFVEEQKVSEEDEFDEFESESKHFIAYIDSEPAGAARWRITEKGIKLERFAILDKFRAKGIGSALVDAVLKDIESEGLKDQKLYLHSQIHAVPLYEKFDFEKVGDEFLECDIRHFEMQRIL
ncbi:MAG: GNAT family N-acetyltransferase [Bacteroidota bacterium]